MKNAATQQQLAFACRELADEIGRGPSFFDSKGNLTEAAERYTGARLTREPDRCALVAALKMLDYSDRQIAALCKCDVRSIPLMVEEIQKTGAIPALKERLIRLTGRNAEQSAIALGELIGEVLDGKRSMELAAMVKSVGGVNVFLTEKLQLLTGAPTEILAQVGAAKRDEVDAWAKANAIPIEVIGRAIDSDSTADGVKPQQIATSDPQRHMADTCPDLPTAPTTTDEAQPKVGGGGLIRWRRVGNDDGLRAFKILNHDARAYRRLDYGGRLGGTTWFVTRDVAQRPRPVARR